jgi:hypothetical protein
MISCVDIFLICIPKFQYIGACADDLITLLMAEMRSGFDPVCIF